MEKTADVSSLSTLEKGELTTDHAEENEGKTDLIHQSSASTDVSVDTTIQTTRAKQAELYGYGLMVSSAIAYTAHSVLVRAAESFQGVSAATTVLVRSVVQIILALGCLYTHPDFPFVMTSLTRRQTTLLVVRGSLGGVALYLLYMALRMLPVGDVTAIFLSTPVFTLVMSRIAMAESITAIDCAAFLLSAFGIIMITRSEDITIHSTSVDTNSFRIEGVVAALSSAALTATAYTVVRLLGETVHFMISVLAISIAAFIISIVLGGVAPLRNLVTDKAASSVVIPLLLAAAFAGFLAQSSTNRGLQIARAGPALLVRNVELPLSYISAVIFLNERLSLSRVVGATFIVSSALIIGIQRILQR